MNTRLLLALATLLVAGSSTASATNCIPVANRDGDWLASGLWGSANPPGNNTDAYDDTYIRRNNSITLNSDVSANGTRIRYLIAGDGFETPPLGAGALTLGSGANLSIAYVNSATAIQVVNRARNRPNSVGTITLEGNAILSTAYATYIGTTTTAYDTAFLASHTVPSTGTLTIKDTATLRTATLIIGTSTTYNAPNIAAGFPATSGTLEVVGTSTTLTVTGATTLNNSGTLKLTSNTTALPVLTFPAATSTESGFTLHLDLAAFDFTTILANNAPATIPVLTLKDAATATAFKNNALLTASGHNATKIAPSITTSGNTVSITLTPLAQLDPTGTGIIVGHEPTPNPSAGTGTFPFIADPAIAKLPDGTLIMSHSIAGPNDATNPTTKIYRSTDHGNTWEHTANLTNIRRASLIVQDTTLSLVGASNITASNGALADHVVVRQSTDAGSTWTPAQTTYSATGVIQKGGTGTSKTPAVLNNRVYLSAGLNGLYSAPITANLLNSSSWKFQSISVNVSNTSADRQSWPADIAANSTETWSESQVLASPETGITVTPKIQLNVPPVPSAVAHSAYTPHTALFRTTDENTALTFNRTADFIPLPGTQKKFGATYDPVSKKFYAITGTVLPAFENSVDSNSGLIKHELIRNSATLYSSTDLAHWELEKIILHSNNPAHTGWQYFSFITDGDHLLIASRTAMKTAADQYEPKRAHDSNLLTFHRLESFRTTNPVHKLTIENGTVTRNEITHADAAPLGNFVLGSQPQNPVSIAQLSNNTILVKQADNQVLQYDSQGNYLGISTAAFPATGNSTLNVEQTKTPQRSWTQPGGGVWFDARNWHYWNIPDTTLETLTLGSAITGNSTITLDRPVALNSLTLRSANSYTLNATTRLTAGGSLISTGSITLDKNPSTNAAPSLTNALGNHTLNSDLTLASAATITLAGNTTLAINGTLTLNATTRLNIDLAGNSPDTPPLTISTLDRSNPSAQLQITLSNSPANIATPLNLIRISTLQNITTDDIAISTPDGTAISFTYSNGTISLTPPPPPVTLVNEYPTPGDTSDLNWFGSSGIYINRSANPGIEILGTHTDDSSASSIGLHHAITYFADHSKPVTLHVGHTLTLTAQITPTDVNSLSGSNAFRIGLFNTRNLAENIVTGDSAAGTNTSTGYMAALHTSNGTFTANNRSPIGLVTANASATYALITMSTAFQNLSGTNTNPVPGGKLTQNQTYTIQLKITRTGDTTIAFDATLSGGDLANPLRITATDDTTKNRDGMITTQFDTIAFASANNGGLDSVRFTDITLTTPQADTAPVVLVQPQSQNLPHDSTLNLSTTANGLLPMTYQWLFNNNPIPGATNQTLTLTHATRAANAGNYTCTITNSLGNSTTEPALIDILPPPPPLQTFINDYPVNSTEHHLTWYGSTTNVVGISTNSVKLLGNIGNNAAASPTGLRHILTHFADTSHPVSISTGETITVSMKITPLITTELSASNALRVALLNSFNNPQNIISSDSNPGGVSAAGYTAYYHSNTGGLQVAARRNTPPPDSDEDAVYASSVYINYSYPYTSLASKTGLIPGNVLLQNQTYTLTHSVTRINDTTASITVTISGGHLAEPATFTTTDTAAKNNRDNAIVTEFDTIAIAASGNGGLDTINITDIQVIIPEQPEAPYIHTQPSNQRLLAGGTATFYTNAVGTLPLSYQWLKDGAPINGATSQTLTFANATLDDDGWYSCQITNTSGTTTTDLAQLAIRTPQNILAPTPASYIANHMVLQRNKPNTIWGTANPNDPITVTLVNTATGETVATNSTLTDATGNFTTVLPALPHSATPHKLTISNALDTTTITDILIGENWLCGGQSNMTWPVGSANNAAAEIADSANYPLLRIYKTVLTDSVTPMENSKGTWKLNTPANIRSTTGVGYYFCRTLAQTVLQGIPVGLLDANRGGSSAQAWMEREFLRNNGYPTYANQNTGKDPTHDGASLYNAIIHPIRHASIAGIIWYQGEHNSTSYAVTVEYRDLFPKLIDNWRNTVFQQPDVPFYFVLLANFIRVSDKTSTGWAWGRYAQLFALDRPNTAYASAVDVGDWFNTHPGNKQDVGIRLALNALKNHYGYNLEDTGPEIIAATNDGISSNVTISLSHANNLVLDYTRQTYHEPDAEKNIPNGYDSPSFQVTDSTDPLTTSWQPATATIKNNYGNGATLILTSNVTNPKQVRYAWDNAPSNILFSTATHPVTGAAYPLPLTPFIANVTFAQPPTHPDWPSLTTDQLLAYALTTGAPTEIPQTNGTSTHLPVSQITNGTLSLTFTPTRETLTYEVQQSLDLQTWLTIHTTTGNSTAPVPVTIPATSNTTTTPQQFLRLKITPAQ